ncbi:peptide chain release factor N(5)-glutamine methyltransferase [Pontibacillus yanchengensis]|uniref:Release factor glutamine methyltransferase n=3 Tax=Pontibacillus yanchengensis TaxID=462910 RepID=A0A6I5A5R1_9BACI|nr:peptide chain release factor N(5)-glutamine methyltransferase [Pontibacillus yanchengensis]MYL35680.1 peptide chain release factor N(5)-glutamine methyltransferase [Pontibacillus yanchengensis]MYL54603.1 peptide chain release factor N(5)-glutamine methyltransferase [Pontibacillus yanchengensis]
MEAKTIFEVRRWTSLFLQENNRETGVGELLLQHHLGMTRAQLFANARDEVSVDVRQKIELNLRQHVAHGTPVQHLIGTEEFYGRLFKVNQDVLIPRPETEELVLGILNRLKQKGMFSVPLTCVDIGTGSGIIATTLTKELPHATMYATDISTEALQVAEQNAHALDATVQFRQGNFLAPVIDEEATFDVIVSNPPYIPERDRDSLSDVVRDHDPSLALFAGEDGLAAYRRIIEQLPSVVKKDTLLALEIGHDQRHTVPTLIEATFPNAQIEVEQDINQNDRMVFAWLSK